MLYITAIIIKILIIGKSILATSNIPINNIAKTPIINKEKYIPNPIIKAIIPI